MKKNLIERLVLSIVICFYSEFCFGQLVMNDSEESRFRPNLAEEFEKSLSVEILQKWYPATIDTAEGGFFSSFTFDWELAENQDKMIVSQARHVWTSSKAANISPNKSIFKKAAAHGFEFLKNKMWDEEYGGFFDLVDRKGSPITNKHYSQYKRSYGNAFGIYALAAYYEISKDPDALHLAQKTFLWLENHAHDSLYGGYFPSLTREGHIVLNSPNLGIFENISLFNKDQNTSIHLLEAFTELYKVWPDKLVEIRLKEMLQIVRDSISTESGYLQLYFYQDWTPISLKDSTDAIIEANYVVDHVSFGHDIETAYLILEASHVLGKYEWNKTLKRAKKMVDHTLYNGFDEETGGIFEQGYYFKNNAEIKIVDARKNWWAQAEGLNSLLLFSLLYPEEKQYQTNFFKQWEYIKKYVIDDIHGGWFPFGTDTEPAAKYSLKGHIWKASYHEGRALMNIIRMLKGEGNLVK